MSGSGEIGPKLPGSIQLGLWGPTLAEQGFGPFLDAHDMDHFQQDDAAISRLHVRGLITYSQHIAAREKLAKKIKAALKIGVTA